MLIAWTLLIFFTFAGHLHVYNLCIVCDPVLGDVGKWVLIIDLIAFDIGSHDYCIESLIAVCSARARRRLSRALASSCRRSHSEPIRGRVQFSSVASLFHRFHRSVFYTTEVCFRTLVCKKIESEADALAVIAALHARGVRTVILSSLDADPFAQMPGSDKAGVSLVGYISTLMSAQSTSVQY